MCSRVNQFTTTKVFTRCAFCGDMYSDRTELGKHRLTHVGEAAKDIQIQAYRERCLSRIAAGLRQLKPSSAQPEDLNGATIFVYRNGMLIAKTKSTPNHHYPGPLQDQSLSSGREQNVSRTGGPSFRSWPSLLNGFKVERKQTLKQQLVKSKRKLFQCRTCQKVFRNGVALQLHAVNAHCQKPFSSDRETSPVRRCIQHAPNKVRCGACRGRHQPVPSENAPQKSSETVQDTSLTCKICNRTFAKQTGLNGHMKVHSSKSNPFCSLCHKSFPHQNKRCEHIVRTFTCSQCQDTFADRNAYRRHMRYHSNNRPWQCEYCPKRFSQSAHLRTHIRWHRGEKPFKCPYCDRRFSQSGHLNEHKRLHTGERPFVCDFCGNKYHLSSSLRSHRRVHTGERPYQCSVCFHTFSQSSALKVHMRGHHGSQSYSCRVCGKGFLSSASLANHTRVHSNKHGFHCKNCGRNFSTAVSLQTHSCFRRQ